MVLSSRLSQTSWSLRRGANAFAGIAPAGLAGLTWWCSSFQRDQRQPTTTFMQTGRAPQFETTAGKYVLSCASKEPWRGSYHFDASTRHVQDEKDGLVGVFSSDPVQSEELLWGTPGDKEIPVLKIRNSEIMEEIQNPDNEGAYFVLPSQLNGAEYPSNIAIVSSIDEYRFDNTGGPRGQLAVHPAPGQFILDNAANDGRLFGINAVQDVVEALNHADMAFRLENGYLVVPELPLDKQNVALTLLQKHLHTMKILKMEDIPASGLKPNKRDWSQARHHVNLVYASAVPVQAYMNQGNEQAAAFQRAVASKILIGQYFGALKAAASRAENAHRIRVFLMPLGGGVFNNPWDIIFLGIARALELLSAQERAKLDIQVLVWKGNPREAEKADFHLKRLNKLASSHSKL